MPTPHADETEADFVDRCIPVVIEEGTAEDGEQAAAICHSMYREHKSKMSATPMFILDQFVTTKPGDPIRLFPFGNVVKGGIKRTITPEVAAKFKLPDFKPPIKLGSHDDETPAGGWIVDLEVRPDGLYAIPEWTEAGLKALAEGAYRYQSPEVIWEDDAIEDARTGQWVHGPMILGDALLHTPHLGEAASLFTIEPVKGAVTMETVSVPKNLWERILEVLPLGGQKHEADPTASEEYKALVQEREDFKAKYEAMKAEAERKAAIGALVAELQNKEKFGMVYVELKAAEEAAQMMASMTPEQREWCMRNFSALALQIKESNLTSEVGKEGEGSAETDPVKSIHERVTALAAEKKIEYGQAVALLRELEPDLFKAAYGPREK